MVSCMAADNVVRRDLNENNKMFPISILAWLAQIKRREDTAAVSGDGIVDIGVPGGIMELMKDENPHMAW